MTPPTEQPGSQPAAPPADGARWRGHTHKELYLLLHDGPGPAASAEPSRRWAEIATALGEIGEDLQKALEQSGASWTGKAAGAAYDRLSVTAAWATDTGADAAGMRTAVETQAEHVARARADMPAPEDVPPVQPDPTVAPAMQVVQAQTDLEAVEATASSAEERAFEVMAAYELNTNTTTGAMSTFEAPPVLDRRDEVHQGQAVGTQHTHGSSAGVINLGGHGGGHGHGGPHLPGTSGASAPWVDDVRRPFAPTQGSFSGVLDPLLLGPGDRSHRHSKGGQLAPGSSSGAGGGFGGGAGGAGAGGAGGSGSGSGPGSNGVPTAGPSSVAGGSSSGAAVPKSGPVSLGGMPASDLQAAAAGHAAAVHHASAGPVAPAAGGGVGAAGGQDRMALRRFGMEAIGSNQWFGDDEAVVGESPRRRRDFREPEQVTESVSILGEEHKLSPTVIGDGPTDR